MIEAEKMIEQIMRWKEADITATRSDDLMQLQGKLIAYNRVIALIDLLRNDNGCGFDNSGSKEGFNADAGISADDADDDSNT